MPACKALRYSDIVDSEQLRLLPPPRPFANRLGSSFFKELPKSPGVYLMRDQAEKIIYVGQSCNLKQRLTSYKYLNPDKTSRKIMRLMFRVAKVEWKLCNSPEEALLLENALLAAHNPTYNTANVYPKAYRYLRLGSSDSSWQISLTAHSTDQGTYYGAFKGSSYAAYASLIRLVWTAIYEPRNLESFPCSFLSEKPPKHFEITRKASCDNLWEQLHLFLAGEGDQLLETLMAKATNQEHSKFMANFLAQDLASIQSFFAATQRNRSLREKFQIPTSYIPQEQLNELILRNRKRKKEDATDVNTSEAASAVPSHFQNLQALPLPTDRPPLRVVPDSRPLSYQPLFL
ncbi:MAG: GIY-YIG nuclease family protein [Verrucomicrobiales bacterium]